MASKEALIHQLEESPQIIEKLVAKFGWNQEIDPGSPIRKTLSLDHIYQEWQHTHEQLKIAIRALPPEING